MQIDSSDFCANKPDSSLQFESNTPKSTIGKETNPRNQNSKKNKKTPQIPSKNSERNTNVLRRGHRSRSEERIFIFNDDVA
ncbi:hypothetical protein U1Q18_052432 [Sarracenia purpurea var. burkii]